MKATKHASFQKRGVTNKSVSVLGVSTGRMRRGLGSGKATAEGLIESGTALIGSPRTVLAGIERMRERTGFGILVALLQFGILSDDCTWRNMDFFAAEVMPHLRS